MELVLTTQDMQSQFYAKKFYFSYSSLNKLLYCPEIFYNEYILGNREQKDETYLSEGKVIHCLLLEPEKFEEQFIVMHGDLPSPNTRQLVERVFDHHVVLKAEGLQKGTALTDYSHAIIDILQDMNLHQSLKTDEQRVAKVTTSDAVLYWQFLSKKEGKMIIDSDMHERCKAIVEKLKNDPKIQDLLKLNSGSEWWSTVDTESEKMVQMELNKFPFGLKGIIDRIIIDPASMTIRIIDVKTTSKTLKDFEESIKFYRYDLQAAIYILMANYIYKDLVKQGYKIEFRFLVIDKNQQYYPFLVSEETGKLWGKQLHEALQKAEYHYTSKDYTLPYEFVKETKVL